MTQKWQTNTPDLVNLYPICEPYPNSETLNLAQSNKNLYAPSPPNAIEPTQTLPLLALTD